MKPFKMWQEFKVLILTSVGRKRKKDTSTNSTDKREPRRHSSCPPNQENRENSRLKNHKPGKSTVRSTSSGRLLLSDDEQLIESQEEIMTDQASPEADALADLNHAAARHRIAIRPNNRRGPSRLAANGAPCSSDGTPSPLDSPTTEEKSKKSLTRSASMSSLDFIQIQEECTALLKTKSHSFKALPALFLMDNDVKYESGTNIGPNVIMVRTLPAMKMSLPESIVTPTNQDGSGYPVIAANTYDTPGVSEEQQEKFRLSIANWCLANEGLRKSIQSLQQPPPMSLCLSSESLASICSGLQALDSGVADISEEIDNNTTDYQIIKMDESLVEMMDDQETDSSAASSSSTHEEDEIENATEVNDNKDHCQKNNDESDDDKQVEVQVLEVDEEVIKQILEEAEDCDDGLMNVNVKERRQCLMQMINTQVIKKVGQKATLSRMAAKNAAVVKMAVKNLNNFQRISESSSNDQETNTGNGNEQNNLETASIIAIEASSKVKLLMAKFDNQ